MFFTFAHIKSRFFKSINDYPSSFSPNNFYSSIHFFSFCDVPGEKAKGKFLTCATRARLESRHKSLFCITVHSSSNSSGVISSIFVRVIHTNIKSPTSKRLDELLLFKLAVQYTRYLRETDGMTWLIIQKLISLNKDNKCSAGKEPADYERLQWTMN